MSTPESTISSPAKTSTNGLPGSVIPDIPGGATPLPYYFPPGAFPVGLDQLATMVIRSTEQDVALLATVPLDAQRQLLTQRLANLKEAGALSDADVATLQSLIDSPDAVTAPPPLLTPEGAPSPCGFIYSLMHRPPSFQDSSAGQDVAKVITHCLAVIGGAFLGQSVGGTLGGIAGGMYANAAATRALQ